MPAVPITLDSNLPAYYACPPPGWPNLPSSYDRCGPCPTPAPLPDLAELAVVGWPIDGTYCDTLVRVGISGRVGQPISVLVTIDERPWSLWEIVRVRAGGPWSCLSNGLAYGPWPAAVPITFPGPGMLPRFYDVAGRRLARPPPSGVYFVRVGGETRKRLVIH
jgi:hypothetical protein